MDIREIARRAKVSTATVSRTINRVPTVDPQLAKRVWKVVEELGYYPNTQARALVSGKSRIFGLIVSEITNPFFPEIVQSFEDIAVQHNYEILLTSTVHDPKRMELAVRRMIERRVDGVAILTFGMEESLIEDLRFRKVPLVFVDVGPDVPGVSQYSDRLPARYSPGGATPCGPAAHPDCLCDRTPPPEVGARPKIRLRIVDEGNRPGHSERIDCGRRSHHGGRDARAGTTHGTRPPPDRHPLLERHDRHRSDARSLRIRNYDPRDLSLVGFDDIRMAQFTTPPLTTVQMSQTQLAELAFKALLSEVERESISPTRNENMSW